MFCEDELNVNTEFPVLVDKPAKFECTGMSPCKGCQYHDDAGPIDEETYVYTCKNGDKQYERLVDYSVDATQYKGIPGETYVSSVWTDDLSADDLVSLRD